MSEDARGVFSIFRKPQKGQHLMEALKTISAIFVPLGFLGGIVQGSILLGIMSAIFWGAIFFWAWKRTNKT